MTSDYLVFARTGIRVTADFDRALGIFRNFIFRENSRHPCDRRPVELYRRRYNGDGLIVAEERIRSTDKSAKIGIT